MGGGGCLGYMSPAAATWVLQYPYCPQMITQTHPKAERRVSKQPEFGKIFRYHPRAYQRENGLVLPDKGPYGEG